MRVRLAQSAARGSKDTDERHTLPIPTDFVSCAASCIFQCFNCCYMLFLLSLKCEEFPRFIIILTHFKDTQKHAFLIMFV